MILEHNSQKEIYRTPLGAAQTNSHVSLRIAVQSDGIPEKVVCIINENEVSMHYKYDMNGSRIYECCIETGAEGGLIFYCFFVSADGVEMFYGNNYLHLGGKGSPCTSLPESRFQITVYKKGFKTPDWMKNAVVYQIFPDRFCSKNFSIKHGTLRCWSDEPFYTPEQFGGEYSSDDFFGGTLKGIESKLDYLKDLGVTALYLNPIFKSPSNHRYDTSDYESVDDNLGTNEDFLQLAKKAKENGIHIILDGVFSHTGSDSRYFNKNATFNSTGAYQSKESPYYSWYTFSDFPDKYDSWWGFETLPNVNEMDESYLDYIARGKESIIKKWIRMGADGWRLDVADELPDEFISELRKAVKSEKKDALLIGEVWEDASNKNSYGKQRKFLWGNLLDSVMNYVFREAVLDFLVNCDSSLFAMRMASLIENYPSEALYSALNLISSHDVPRALTVLSGAPDFRSLSRIQQHDYKISEEALQLGIKRMKLATVLQMTLPGTPCIYYGDEAGMQGYADPFNRTTYPWGNENSELFEITQKMALLRNLHQCLKTGKYEMLYYYGGVISYMRSIDNGKDVFEKKHDDESMVIILNSGEHTQYGFSLELERFGISAVYDAFSGENYEYNGRITVDLQPFSYKILRIERNGVKCTKIQSIQ